MLAKNTKTYIVVYAVTEIDLNTFHMAEEIKLTTLRNIHLVNKHTVQV